MVTLTKFVLIATVYGIFTHVTTSRVLELSDRFLDIHKDGQWLVMMYAPWCAHCKRLEPVWAHVAQHLHATSIRVGRVDCTRFTSVAHAFKVKGFPTILFIIQNELFFVAKPDNMLVFAINSQTCYYSWRNTGEAVKCVSLRGRRPNVLIFVRNDGTCFFSWQTKTCYFSLKGENEFTYHGDRTRDEIVKFALRVSGPPVQEITKTQSFDTIKKERDLYFLYVGERSGSLWEFYRKTADVFQPHAFFYQSHPNVVNKHAPVGPVPALFVYKENSHYNFTGHTVSDIEKLNDTLYKWINAERFPTFPKVTRGNINQLFLTNKNLVLAVVEENQLEEVPPHMIQFKDMVESIIKSKREKYHDNFQFGWIASPDLVNSIAMMVLPLPSLIVINTTTNHHHIPEDEAEKLTPHVIELFLEQIHNESAPRYGGNNWLVHIYRSWFELKTTLIAMWMGNPILTMVLFGLPAGFLSLICYGICCPDILDADDEEEDSTGANHMKKD